MKKILLLALTMLCLLASLTACGGQKGTANQQDDTATDTTTDTTTDTASDTASDTTTEEQTISGIVNRLGEFLVLLDDNGDYHTFDFGIDVDPSGLEEGDSVTVTYNGTLDSEDSTPVAIDIEKVG